MDDKTADRGTELSRLRTPAADPRTESLTSEATASGNVPSQNGESLNRRRGPKRAPESDARSGHEGILLRRTRAEGRDISMKNHKIPKGRITVGLDEARPNASP
jgi:hypothetical protein